ncbi:zinc finger BED domain-containing protein 5-like [Protopterus annectens]|uniref:zinc finger BED domain-containing protein 5-like n=1 Tax=Protopterus annectens TaxID=7888 RepID=UPI001CF96D34|nr:zinc finger BED domain-containing protein 5-like [Protopterus annectens]
MSNILVQNTNQAQSLVSQRGKKRKYCDGYMKYGFSYVGNEDCPKPQCMVCGEVLSNGSMKPSLLLRHLETKHANYKNKEYSFFKRLVENNKRLNLTSYILSGNKDYENAVEASYHIGKCGKSRTIAENLISPCITEAIRCMLGEEHVRKMTTIPLSNNTISRRIEDMSDDVEMTVIGRIKSSKIFAIQVYESTDVANCAILLAIARYLKDNEVEENLLLCHPLSQRTRGEGILNVVDYFKEEEINWSNCCGLCTDGAKSMLGIYSGLCGLVMKVAPNISWSHCCIHRQSLACKNFPGELKLVLDEAVKVVNFIKSKSTNSRIFKALCEEMMSPHSTVLLHTEVRWLSRGKVLTQLFELRHEVQVFFEDHPFFLASKLQDCNWLQALAYLSDIFQIVNKLNLALQNSSVTIFNVSDKIESMIKKIDFWRSCLENGQPELFKTLHNFLSENKLNLSWEIRKKINEHLNGLKLDFQKYFPELEEEIYWISNPFEEQYVQAAKLSVKEKEKLIELSTDSTLNVNSKDTFLLTFGQTSAENTNGFLTTPFCFFCHLQVLN